MCLKKVLFPVGLVKDSVKLGVCLVAYKASEHAADIDFVVRGSKAIRTGLEGKNKAICGKKVNW